MSKYESFKSEICSNSNSYEKFARLRRANQVSQEELQAFLDEDLEEIDVSSTTEWCDTTDQSFDETEIGTSFDIKERYRYQMAHYLDLIALNSKLTPAMRRYGNRHGREINNFEIKRPKASPTLDNK